MTHEDAFLQAIRESPGDVSLRLVYADFLDESGQPGRAEFLRVLCEWARLPERDRRREALAGRGQQLLEAHREEWLGALLRMLDGVPWLEHLGQPTARDGEVCRLGAWDEWPGPYEPRTDRLYDLYRTCHDCLLDQAGPFREEARGLWEQVREAVFLRAKRNVPYRDDQDPWHGPSKAAWDVSCWAALVAIHVLLGRDLQEEFRRVWSWVAAGHWPCGYVEGPAPGPGHKLMVY